MTNLGLRGGQRDLWVAIAVVASGLIWTIAAYVAIPDVALGLGFYFGHHYGQPPRWLVPAEHGMPVWAVGFCWLSTGVLGIAAALSRGVDDLMTKHRVVYGFLLVLLFFLVGWFTWL